MESQEEMQCTPSQGGEGTASFQEILEKLEHSGVTRTPTGMCRGRQEGACRKESPLTHPWDAPQGKVGLAQPWAHSIDFRIQQGQNSNPNSATNRDVLENIAELLWTSVSAASLFPQFY